MKIINVTDYTIELSLSRDDIELLIAMLDATSTGADAQLADQAAILITLFKLGLDATRWAEIDRRRESPEGKLRTMQTG